MEEVYKFLKKSGTYFIATVDGDQPRVRPFGTVELFENKFYIQTGKVKKVSEQIKGSPKIEICAMTDDHVVSISYRVKKECEYNCE